MDIIFIITFIFSSAFFVVVVDDDDEDCSIFNFFHFLLQDCTRGVFSLHYIRDNHQVTCLYILVLSVWSSL